MCYYRSVKIKNDDLLKINSIERQLEDVTVSVMDGFAYSLTPIIIPKAECGWEIVRMEWGFIPSYLKNREAVDKFRRGYTDENGKYRPAITTLNAIGEELLMPGKMYREATLKRRCLFISNCFFEWRHIYPMGKKGQPLKTAVKYPYCIRTKEKYHLTAGIWQKWIDRETGETVDTCALVTTKANSILEQIHNSKKRMPTILTPELAGEWISDGLSEERITQIATYQYPSEQIEAWTIAKDFKTALEPTERFEWEPIPELYIDKL